MPDCIRRLARSNVTELQSRQDANVKDAFQPRPESDLFFQREPCFFRLAEQRHWVTIPALTT